MVCTENYVSKANEGKGGVGYEKMIITSNLMKQIDENKIIPIIRQIDSSNVPVFLKTKLHVNFYKDSDFEFSYDELVRTIHNSPLFVKPPVGNNPFKPVEKINQQEDVTLIDTLLQILVKDYSNESRPSQRYVTSDMIILELGVSRILAEIAAAKIVESGLASWKLKNESIELTEKGKLYAIEKGIA